MNINELKQYRALEKEIAMLKQKVDRLSVRKYKYGADSVTSSSPAAPYRKSIVVIRGYGYDAANDHAKARLKKHTRERLHELNQKFGEIQAFIDSIDDSIVRQIVEYRYIEGLSWAAIGKIIYDKPTESTPRMIVERFFEKK